MFIIKMVAASISCIFAYVCYMQFLDAPKYIAALAGLIAYIWTFESINKGE